jgi:monoamine oxidase
MRVSRRAFLAGASATIVSRARATADVDVVIIGAGAAGLAAAKHLRAAGRSFIVLEARDRIGGRAYTDTSLGVPFDAGAQYIHWAERNPWKRIADELGVALQEDAWSGPPLVYVNGMQVSKAERQRRRRGFERIWEALSLGAAADKSFADAVRGGPPELIAAAGGVTQFALGEDPERVSIADYEQLWAGDDYLVPSGYGALVARYGADIPVRLGMTVSAIRWGEGAVEVETTGGTLKAAAAIVTVPIGVLKPRGIRFTPELPNPIADAIEGLGMGAYTKIALRLDRARIGQLEATDYFEVLGDTAATSFEFWPFGHDLVVAVMGGDHGRRLCEAGERAAVDFVTGRLTALLGSRVRDAVMAGRLAGWWSDPYARGSYSVARPGHVSARTALREPVADRIWFAGEATAAGGAMTVGGATLEGERAAREAAARVPR